MKTKPEPIANAVSRAHINRPLKKADIASPLTLLYHGTDKEFDIPTISGMGAHFGTRQQAEFMAKYREGLNCGNKGVIKIYKVVIRNPIRMHDTGFTDPDLMMHINPPDALKKLPSEVRKKLSIGTPEDIRKKLIELGYDGVVYVNTTEEGAGDSYIAFSPEQIRPVIA